MLSSPDAALVGRERALPGLRTLLDPDGVRTLLDGLRGEEPGVPARLVYLRYKPRTSCLAVYEFAGADGQPDVAYAKAYREGARERWGKYLERLPAVEDPDEARRRWERDAVLVYRFPTDAGLRSLDRLKSPKERRRLFRTCLPARKDLWRAGAKTLRYKPERRYVALLHEAARPLAVVKLYSRGAISAAATNARAFRSDGPLEVAHPIGGSDRHRALIFPWLPGMPPGRGGGGDAVEGFRRAGAALARLHAQTPQSLARWSTENELRALRGMVAGLRHIHPGLWSTGGAVVREIATHPALRAPALVPLHGDFNASQVLLLADGRTALIDLDRAAWGDPALDLGNCIAHLERDAVYGAAPDDVVAAHAAALIEGYAAVTPAPAVTRLHLFTAAGLLRLVHEPFRVHHPEWTLRMEALVRRASARVREASRCVVCVGDAPS